MKNHLILAIVLLISACASKYPMKVDLSDYKTGLEITESPVSKKHLFSNACLVFDNNIPVLQKLRRLVDNRVMYTYSNNWFLENYNKTKLCDNKNSIKIIELQPHVSWSKMMRLNIYIVQVSVVALHQCKGKLGRFSATKQSKLTKGGKLISMGVLSDEQDKAMIAAVVALAFDAAITDIYQQIKQQCQ